MSILNAIDGSDNSLSLRNLEEDKQIDIRDIAITQQMREVFQSFNEDKFFAFVSLGLSDREIEVCKTLDICNGGGYMQYGGDISSLQDKLISFLRPRVANPTDDTLATVAAVITKTAERVIRAMDQETALIMVRTFMAHTIFDIPRWHTDGVYFNQPGTTIVKFATALKGPGTLFHRLPEEKRAEFRALAEKHDRAALARFISDGAIESGEVGQGAFFAVGDPQLGAVHSEPSMSKETRLFFSVLPGSQSAISRYEQLQEEMRLMLAQLPREKLIALTGITPTGRLS